MAKYIGTYATSGDVQTAINNNELNRPFVAYTTSDGQVYYGADMTLAQVGDIVVYATSDQLLHYIPQANYNTTTYPTASFVPVGVVAATQTADLSSVSDVTFMGIKWLSLTNPDGGTDDAGKNMNWGNNVLISGLTNYTVLTGDTGAINDKDGKSNTAAVLEYATGQTDWRTAAEINNSGDGTFPAFECSWRYHTSGTSQGDWYVPAVGELYPVYNNSSNLNAVKNALTTLEAPDFFGTSFGSSTQTNKTTFWINYGPSSYDFYNNEQKTDPGFRRQEYIPFCQMPMTAI